MTADVIIIGGGIAGSAAALRAVQYNLQTIWIRGDAKTRKRSRGQWVANIDNMIGIHDGIVRKKIAKSLKGDALAEARALVEGGHAHIGSRDIIDDTLERVADYPDAVTIVDGAATDASVLDGGFAVMVGEDRYEARHVVMACGVMDRQPKIKKAKGDAVIDEPKWVYPFANRETVLYCIRCEGHLTTGSCTVVIGAGEAAAQLAMMLHERYGSGCAVLTNGDEPAWADESQRLLDAYEIPVHRERIVDMVGPKGTLGTIVLDGGAEVSAQFALVSMGLFRVYNELAIALGVTLEDAGPVEERHVLIDKKGETSVRNVFAVGDMARRPDEGVMKQIYTSQEYAVRAVDTVDRRTRKAKRAAVLAAL